MRCLHGETGICTARPLNTTKVPWAPSCGPEETPPAQGHHRAPGPENKTPLCGDFLWWVGAGQSFWSLWRPAGRPCRISCCMCRMLSVAREMSVGLDPTDRIVSKPAFKIESTDLVCLCRIRRVVLCPACWEKIPPSPSTNPAGPVATPPARPAQHLSLASPRPT